MFTESKKNTAALSRRAFLGLGATAAVVAGAGLTGCAPSAKPEAKTGAAKSTTDWLGAEPEVKEIKETIETEILVCGGGTGGLFTACAAAEGGAKVIVLEKGAVGGGVRDNIGSLNSRLQKEAGCVIDKNEIMTDMIRYADNYCNARLYQLWADNSGEAVDWYQDRIEERGYKLWFEAADEAHPTFYKHYATGHIPSWPADAEFAGIDVEVNGKVVLGDYAEKLGVETRFNTPMVKLVKTGDKVTGAIAKGKDGYVQINASKGVVVCTGGYARNTDMLEALQPHTHNKYSKNIAIDGTSGDGIKACLWAGAHMDEIHTSMVFDRVAVPPTELGGADTAGELFWMGSNPWLKVNLNGERFCNESAPYDYVLNSALTQPGHTFCNIWDSNYESYLKQFDIHGCARVFPFANGAPTNIPFEAVVGMNQGLQEKGFIQQADTIEELAKKLNIDAATLKATVARQNENFAAQADPDFNKDTFRLSAIDKAPFFGCRTSGYLLCTLDGVTINEKMQAVNGDGKAIEGLYVVGVDSGSYYAHTYPNLSTGNCCGRTVTFGRMVGKALAAQK
ncbi:MAG: FAD-dependent oxidoreductase [Raoultibacter sp.]